MRHTSYRNLLWMAVLLAALVVGAPAQHAASRPTSPPTQQLSIASAQANAQSSRSAPTPNTNAQKAGPWQNADQVETAGMIPEPTSLLPVAALVGFSFLLGGIVCGTIKRRP